MFFREEEAEKRFEVQRLAQDKFIKTFILTDQKTGIQYLFSSYGTAGGLTPLLDGDGKPMKRGL
ncbi:MAG: DUF6440 family protein [Tissierellia bacterium]|nr:DUF6440 family protein [Tissierellia bacterium]